MSRLPEERSALRKWTLIAALWWSVSACVSLPRPVQVTSGVGPELEPVEAPADGGREGTSRTDEWVHMPVRIHSGSSGVELDEEARAMLRELAASAAHRGDVVRIRVEGHDDGQGSSGASHRRARARAQAAVDYLVQELGMPREMLELVTHGDERPLTSDTAAADRAQNRRVEFSVLVRRNAPPSDGRRVSPAAAPVVAPHPTFSPPAGTPASSVPTLQPLVVPRPVQPSVGEIVHLPMLTATSVGDADRRGPYLDYLMRHPFEATQIGLDMSRRVRFRVLDQRSRPINDATITFNAGGRRVEGRTHADGTWDFFPGVISPQAQGSAQVTIRWGNHQTRTTVPIPAAGDAQDVVIQLNQAVAPAPTTLDLAFLIDVTGSMGDELEYVNDEVQGIVRRVREANNQVNIRVGATFYRDRGDMHPLQQIDFTDNVGAFNAQMSSISAGGGGDYPEDVNAGLEAALTRMSWSQGSSVRVLVMIADAPPQRYPDAQYTYHHAMLDAGRRGIRVVPVAASGADRVVEYLFRAMGAFTSTPYVYLTDDSGIGAHHMEADTDRISVEMFSDLLTRMLISDLQGLGMHEPSHAEQGGVMTGVVR